MGERRLFRRRRQPPAPHHIIEYFDANQDVVRRHICAPWSLLPGRPYGEVVRIRMIDENGNVLYHAALCQVCASGIVEVDGRWIHRKYGVEHEGKPQ